MNQEKVKKALQRIEYSILSEEVDRLRMDNLLVCKESLEKQVAKKPESNGHVYLCPVCHGSLWQIQCESNYCFRCGQKIDWEER